MVFKTRILATIKLSLYCGVMGQSLSEIIAELVFGVPRQEKLDLFAY